MKPLNLNGSRPATTALRPSEGRSTANSQAPRSSALRPLARVVSLDEYRAQRRAKRIAWNILLASFVAIGMITTGAALHQEQRLQMMEVGK
jgi:hypothetical protein